MRLRYLHLQNYLPISDLKVCFASASPLARDCAVRFVVGVNGSGKSNLLRAVAEVFLALADGRRTTFPVRMIYELGRRDSASFRTLVLDWFGGRDSAALWIGERHVFPEDATAEQFDQAMNCFQSDSSEIPAEFRPLIRRGEWPAGSVTPQPITLPAAVLAYTTGDMRPWRSVWSRNQDARGLLEERDSESELNEERPAGWTVAQEVVLQAARQAEGNSELTAREPARADTVTFLRPILLDATLLKCALLAVALPQAFAETANYPGRAETDAAMAKLRRRDDNKNPLQELLERSGWCYLVSVGLRSRLQPNNWDRKLCETAYEWWFCAGEVISEPHPLDARRTLVFDLKGAFDSQGLPSSTTSDELTTCATQGEALWTLLGGADATTFELFTRLLELNRAGLFDDVLLCLRRKRSPEPGTKDVYSDVGVLRYEELSDGEQMFLGRMALLHLLQGQDDSVLLLDEPETHFNDLWKRDVVSIVDDALEKTSVEVLIATHSALMLTDALKSELVVLERIYRNSDKNASETSIRLLDRQTHTFGATGDHPLRDIFGASDTVGRRASRLLEVLIAAASMATEIDANWALGTGMNRGIVAKVFAVASKTESGLTEQSVENYLRSIESFAVHFGAEQPLQMRAVLETFIEQTGPGYFQVELKRAWRHLQEGAFHAA